MNPQTQEKLQKLFKDIAEDYKREALNDIEYSCASSAQMQMVHKFVQDQINRWGLTLERIINNDNQIMEGSLVRFRNRAQDSPYPMKVQEVKMTPDLGIECKVEGKWWREGNLMTDEEWKGMYDD